MGEMSETGEEQEHEKMSFDSLTANVSSSQEHIAIETSSEYTDGELNLIHSSLIQEESKQTTEKPEVTSTLTGGSASRAPESQDNHWAYADFNLKMNLAVQFNPVSGAAVMLGVDNIDLNNGRLTQTDKRISDISGYTAGSSNTASSTCSATYINPPKGLLRLSEATVISSSSGSTDAIRIQEPQKILSKKRLTYLKDKYLNHELLYHILNYIDEVVTQVPHEEEQQQQQQQPPNYLSRPILVKRSSKRLLEKNPKRPKLEEIKEQIRSDKIIFAKSSKNSNKYFPGKSWNITESGDYMIEFYNGDNKRISKQCIFEEFQEGPAEKKVMFLKPNKYGRKTAIPALVSDIKIDEEEILCSLITDEGDVDGVHISYLYLTDDIINELYPERRQTLILPLKKAKRCYSETSTATATDTEKNIELEFAVQTDPLPTTSTGQQAAAHTTDTGSDTTATATDTHRKYVPYLSSASSDDSDPPEEVVDGCHPEKVFYLPILDVKVKSKSRKPTIKDSAVLGPLNKGDWFNGMAFILTCSRYCESVDKQETIVSDDENFVFSRVPFVHTHLVAQIQLGGGHVFENYSDVPPHFVKSLVLIAPAPCLTARYVECMSHDVKVVCHEWIINCCKSKSRLPYQELPLGWSLEQKRFIDSFERQKNNPFKNLLVRITSRTRSNSFFEFWSKIMRTCGAEVRSTRRVKFAKDLIIIDGGYRLTELPVAVTPTWVIQSILHGEMRDISAEKVYKPRDL